jgi:alanyl aminopeptidase
MAHQWFGDLVTTAWWNDIWLNEAFASWMASRVISHWKPEWNTKIDEQNTRLRVMGQDSLVSARQIRQPIENHGDILNAFDDITYSKGEAVIGMFESWMGEEAFRKGVRQYLRQYSWRNATAGDFLDSLQSAGSTPVTRAFSTFLDQPGVPLVSVKLNCDKPDAPSLHLTQKRALPLGSPGSGQQTWQIPVCVRYGEGAAAHRACVLLTQPTMDWKLTGARSCPVWIQANADGGYYRTRYEDDLLGKVLANGGQQLTPAERVTAMGDVEALVGMGEVKAGDALALTPQFARDPVRQVVSSAIGIVSGVRDLVPGELLPNYSRFVNQTFGERARKLGWKPVTGEEAETQLLRVRLLPFVAVRGRDPALSSEARQLADRWLSDRKSVAPDIAGSVLGVAARGGDEGFFKQLQTALTVTKEQPDRDLILNS